MEGVCLVSEHGALRQEYVGEILKFLATKFTDTGDMLVEMPEEAPASKSSTEHSRDHNTFIHLVACGSPAPHRVRAAEGHEIWIEKFERFSPQFISVFAQFILPEVGHVILTETFEGHLGHGLLEEGKRVWQVVPVAQVPDICDPVLTTGRQWGWPGGVLTYPCALSVLRSVCG